METLANKLRPTSLNEVAGQKHLIGENKILSNLVKNNKIFNMIFYGKSGIGKTTIALALMNELKINYRILNATINSKKDFEVVFEESKMYDDLVLIVDEIHRMNKDKQDLLLSFIESGQIILIGLTSSNPYHSINPAIRSRCQLIELKELSEEDIINALDKVKNVYSDIVLTDEIKSYIARLSAGDLRYAYNLIEFCYNSFGSSFTIENIKEISSRTNIFYDKNEDGYYDVISAFQKSVRGSDVDASVHYLVRLIDAGDFDILYRRMLVIAYEDIGLANPTLQTKVLTAIESAERLGLPELYKPLTQAVIEMALSPKSNTIEQTYQAAINDLRKNNVGRVPEHIRTTSPNYKYPHIYKNHYVKQQYLPDNIKTSKYYFPGDNKYEQAMSQYNEKIKE
ncbi:MAG: replication-associated recombination protein A [Tenericutes bacterium]|nr:replication-associated recombination protein A [Mycoplasmatota bacterium]